MAQVKERRALCGICPAGCWIVASFDQDGRLAAVRADEDSPFGITCKLGLHSPEIVYSENRLLSPLQRKGPKGTFEFEQITWDQAYDEIVQKLQKLKSTHGPEAAAIYTGRGSFELAMCDIFQPRDVAVSSASSVLFPFGSPNTMGVGALCYVSIAMIAPHVTMGGMLINMFSDLEKAELIVVWGANPATDCPPLDHKRIMEAVKRGAKLVVIDPRRTKPRPKSTDAEWLPIRPGTDGALALALCNVLIAEELFDESFVRELDAWVSGFCPLCPALQPGSGGRYHRRSAAKPAAPWPEGLPMPVAPPPSCIPGWNTATAASRPFGPRMVLWALAGQLDVPGGRCFTMKAESLSHQPRKVTFPTRIRKKPWVAIDFPSTALYRGESHANCLPDCRVARASPIRSVP